jgi:hypothetical protein
VSLTTTLEYTLEKVQSCLDLLDDTVESDLPHLDAQEGIKALRETLLTAQAELSRFDETSAGLLVNSRCMAATAEISECLDVLEVINNSADIRNAFELHDPLLYLARQLLGRDARLILSYGGGYIPFTYPLTIPSLPRFVIVGLPASEANNALIMPVAGHELGHSIWRSLDYEGQFEQFLQDNIVALIKGKYWSDYSSHVPRQYLTDITGYVEKLFWSEAHEWATSKLEEIFCDIVGVSIFGLSYLRAFTYLLAPRLSETRSPSYPEITSRVDYMITAAKRLGINDSFEIKTSFQPQQSPFSPGQFRQLLLDLSDDVVKTLFDSLFTEASEYCSKRNLIPPGPADSASIIEEFRSRVPSETAQNFAAIIDAGWLLYSDKTFLENRGRSPFRRITLLNELILKSIELLEIKRRLKDWKERKNNAI